MPSLATHPFWQRFSRHEPALLPLRAPPLATARVCELMVVAALPTGTPCTAPAAVLPQISRVKLEESRRAVAGQDDVVDARHRQHKFKTAQNKVDHMLKRLNEQVRPP